MRTLFFALLLLFSQWESANFVFANQNFEISHDITYTADAQGETLVMEKITIENLTNDTLATVYLSSLKKIDVYNVNAFDLEGKIIPEITRDNEDTNIKLKLKAQIIGKGKKNIITLSYQTRDIAQKVGTVWNINIPKIADQTDYDNLTIALNIPKIFGDKIFISPTPSSTNSTNNTQTTSYLFGPEIILKDIGITASFGIFQTVNFNLKYTLKNDSKFPAVQEIALPPEIKNVQQVYFLKITPQPLKIYPDGDGNYMATFKLKPQQTLNVEAIGTAKIYSRQIDPSKGGSFNDIPKDLSDLYLKPMKYWETDSQEVREISLKLKKSDQNVAANAKYIYDYVINNFKYDFSVITKDNIIRQGAKNAIKNKTSKDFACMEFTDIFIAMARSMGIPAREIDGFAFSNAEKNKPLTVNLRGGDLLHAWPEFYDPNLGWVQIDPTWGNTSGIDYFTKLDTNHFAFVIKGLDSEYPYPAGTYRFSSNEKQVEVDFSNTQVTASENKRLLVFSSQKDIASENKVEIKKIWGWNVFELIKGNRKYKITNKTGGTVYNVEKTDKNLLPFQSVELYLINDRPL